MARSRHIMAFLRKAWLNEAERNAQRPHLEFNLGYLKGSPALQRAAGDHFTPRRRVLASRPRPFPRLKAGEVGDQAVERPDAGLFFDRRAGGTGDAGNHQLRRGRGNPDLLVKVPQGGFPPFGRIMGRRCITWPQEGQRTTGLGDRVASCWSTESVSSNSGEEG